MEFKVGDIISHSCYGQDIQYSIITKIDPILGFWYKVIIGEAMYLNKSYTTVSAKIVTDPIIINKINKLIIFS